MKIKEPRVVGGLGEKKSNGGQQYYQQDRVYSSDGLAMCHPSNLPSGSYRYLMKTNKINVIGRMDNTIDHTLESANRVYGKNGVSPTIPTMCGGGHQPKVIDGSDEEYYIRKLTPRECWRLFGFTDEDYDKAAEKVSRSQLYKQAGNSICKQVLMAIFREMM